MATPNATGLKLPPMYPFSAKRKIPGPQDLGQEFTLRILWTGDEVELAAHLLRLSDADRRIRFGHTVSDRFLQNYAQLMLRPGSMVHAALVDGIIRGVAEARSAFATEGDMEAAFTVETGFKGRGMGTALFNHLMLAVAAAGHRRVVMAVIRSNSRMIALAQKHGAVLLSDYGSVPAGIGDELVEDVLCLILDLANSPWAGAY